MRALGSAAAMRTRDLPGLERAAEPCHEAEQELFRPSGSRSRGRDECTRCDLAD